MPSKQLPHYLREMALLKELYRDKINLLTALEVDYIPGVAGPFSNMVREANLDYVIGSVHYVDSFESGERWSIDNNNSEFEAGLMEIFKGDVREAVKRYFNLQQEMCTNETPHLLGHMDKIKMHNIIKPHFNEKEKWYLKFVRDTLLLAAEKSVIVEINTKYFHSSGILFPGAEHFKWMKDNGVKVTISSDAHTPENLLSGFREVASMLLTAGYNEIWTWKNGGFVPSGFNGEQVTS